MSKAAPPFTKPIGCHRAARVFTTRLADNQGPGGPAIAASAERLTALPAVAADTDANAYAGCSEANACTRTVVPVAIAAALDISLARHIVI